MPDFPELGSGTVHGRFLAGTLDSSPTINPLADTLAPDAEPLGGSVTFTATAPLILVTSADPEPVSFFPQPLTVELDSEGYLSRNGSRDIQLWATNDPQGNPIDWQWHVHFSLTYKGRGVYRQPFNFYLPEGTIVDLTVVAPLIELSNGTIIIQGPPGESASDLINAQGDLITGDAAGDAAILPVGAAGSYLAPEPAAPFGLEWKPFPVPEGGLKVYPDVDALDAVRVAEVGVWTIPDLAAEFPQLVPGYGDIFAGHGPAEVVVTTVISDYPLDSALFRTRSLVHQWFTIGNYNTPYFARVSRIIHIDRDTGAAVYPPQSWAIEAQLPDPQASGSGNVPLSVISGSDIVWGVESASYANIANSVMRRTATGTSQINDPVDPLDIANKRFVDGAVAALPVILTGSGAPDSSVGEPGDFYVDTDTGTLYGPKGNDSLLAGAPAGSTASPYGSEQGGRFTPTVAGDVAAIRLYHYGVAGQPLTVTLWDAAGVAVGTGTVTDDGTIGLVVVPLAAPVTLTPGVEYRVSFTLDPGEQFFYSTLDTWPKVGPTYTLNGGVTGSFGAGAPGFTSTDNYWIEPVFPAADYVEWPIAIAPAAPGLKVYATLAEVEAEREAAVGTVHIPDLGSAFPNLAAVGSGVEDIFVLGTHADLVVTTTPIEATTGGADWVNVGQTFDIYDRLVDKRKVTISRIATLGTSVPANLVGLWQVKLELPEVFAESQVPISILRDGRLVWIEETANPDAYPNRVIRRDSAGQFQVLLPVQPGHATNKDYVDRSVEAIPVIHSGSGAPDSTVGRNGDYYIDTDTGTLYGPKASDVIQAGGETMAPGFSFDASEHGVSFTVDAPGEVVAARLTDPQTVAGGVISVTLWDDANMIVGTGSVVDVAGASHVLEVPLTAPVAVVPGVEYRITRFTAAGASYGYSNFNLFPLTGASGATLVAARYGPDGIAPPFQTAANYWVEPVFHPTGYEGEWPVALAPVVVPDATEVVAGVTRYSTQAEVDAGTDLASTVRPGTLAPYVAGQIAAAPVPPHTHPELGGTRRFLFDATPGGDPGAGHISIENSGGQNRVLRVSKTDADGNAVSLAPLAVNDSVALSHEVSPPTIYARGYAASLATDAVTHWEFTAVRESGTGALPAEGTAVILSIAMANGAGGSVPSGGLTSFTSMTAKPGKYIIPGFTGVFGTSPSAQSTGNTWGIPILVGNTATIDMMTVGIAVGEDLIPIRISLYSSDEDGYPKTLVATAVGASDADGGTLSLMLDAPVTLPPGYYWPAVRSLNGTTLRFKSVNANVIGVPVGAHTDPNQNKFGTVGFDCGTYDVPIEEITTWAHSVGTNNPIIGVLLRRDTP